MADALIEGRIGNDPVLIVAIEGDTATVIHGNGTIGQVLVTSISADWHFDSAKGWVRDFVYELTDD